DHPRPVKAGLLAYLRCPVCQSALTLAAEQSDGPEIMEGRLRCAAGGHDYPIRRGIPRLLADTLSSEQQRTASAFGWQWQHFTEMHRLYERQFLDWIWPIEPAFFKGKLVLDAGCGIGRHAYFAARYGASAVIAMDLSDAVETAFHTIGRLPNAHVIQADIMAPPFQRAAGKGEVDFIYSIG